MQEIKWLITLKKKLDDSQPLTYQPHAIHHLQRETPDVKTDNPTLDVAAPIFVPKHENADFPNHSLPEATR